jgi:hypothetical protein
VTVRRLGMKLDHLGGLLVALELLGITIYQVWGDFIARECGLRVRIMVKRDYGKQVTQFFKTHRVYPGNQSRVCRKPATHI